MTIINTNLSALRAQTASANAQNSLSTAMERLSSGLRINGAKDDAAGLAIAQRMTADVRGLTVAIRNAADGMSLAQTAEGALGEIANQMQRIRELAVQAANGTMEDTDRALLQVEVTNLLEEITNTVTRSNFNGIALLNGGTTHDLQVGTDNAADNQISFNIADFSAHAAAAVDIGTQAGAQAALDSLDTALDAVATERANLGAVQNRLEAVISNQTTMVNNTIASRSRIEDADFAAETTNLARSQILSQASQAMLAQANASQQNVLQLLR